MKNKQGVIEESRREADIDWFDRDTVVEGLASKLTSEIERRSALLGASYPFVRDKNRLTYKPSKSGVYEFCLAVTVSPSLTTGELSKLPMAFEFLTRDTLSIFAGRPSISYRTGAPKNLADGLPNRGKNSIRTPQ